MLEKLRLTGIIGLLLFTLAPVACGDGAKQNGADGGGGVGGGMAGAAGGSAGAPGGQGGFVGDAGAPGGRGGSGGSGGVSGAGGGTGGTGGGAGGQGGDCPSSGTIYPAGACAGGTNCSGSNITCDCVNGFWKQCRIPTCPPSTVSDTYACESDVQLPAGCHCNLVPPGTQNIPYCLCNGM